MILVDSSVWIDYFQGTINAQTERLDGPPGFEPLAIGDLILTEVLQGFHDERIFNDARKMLAALTATRQGFRLEPDGGSSCHAPRKTCWEGDCWISRRRANGAGGLPSGTPGGASVYCNHAWALERVTK